MKKGKVFSKGQVTVAVMLCSLAVAIWLNAKYVPSGAKYLGEASYVNGTAEEDENVVQTSAKAEQGADYFSKTKKEREQNRKEITETIEELLNHKNLTAEDKKTALQKAEVFAKNSEQESNVETLLKAKGFEKTLVVISDKGISIVVGSDGLTSQQTLQIQDVVTTQTDIALENIKIIPVAK